MGSDPYRERTVSANPELIDRLQGINLYLIGLMGSGKSTVGQELALALSYPFFDTDQLIEQLAQQTIPEIFAEQGELIFRDMETQVLAELASYRRLVVATGGGIILKRSNWSYLRHGILVWLDAPIDLILERIQSDPDRPLLKTDDPKETLQQISEQRRSLYSEADLHIVIRPEDSPTQIADRILAAIPSILKDPETPPD
jgi:shikimate kinase